MNNNNNNMENNNNNNTSNMNIVVSRIKNNLSDMEFHSVFFLLYNSELAHFKTNPQAITI